MGLTDNKLLRQVYGVLKSGIPFDENYINKKILKKLKEKDSLTQNIVNQTFLGV